MDDCSLKYGWVTTYNKTRLVKRTGDFTFAVSPLIYRHTKSTSSEVSVKEAIFFLAVKSDTDWQYPGVGRDVVGNPNKVIMSCNELSLIYMNRLTGLITYQGG